jgi:polar amino acid transport system ATP-binding protein
LTGVRWHGHRGACDLENIIEAPIRVRKVSRAAARAHASELLVQVGLAEKINAYSRAGSSSAWRSCALSAIWSRNDLCLFQVV